MADFIGGGFQNSPPPLAGAMSLAQRIIKKRQKRSTQANGGTTAQDNAQSQQGWVEQSMPGTGAVTAAPKPRPQRQRRPSPTAQIAAHVEQIAGDVHSMAKQPEWKPFRPSRPM